MTAKLSSSCPLRRLALGLALATLTCALATAQESPGHRHEPPARTAEGQAELVERLELGISALETLGHPEEAARLRRIADQVRKEHVGKRNPFDEGNREENDEVREVRRRLELMRIAVDALLETGDDEAAEIVEHAMHARELTLARRTDPEAMRVRESAPDRRQLAEVLAGAASLHRDWNHPDRAQALAELAETYAGQWRRRQRVDEPGPGEELDDRGRRVEILRWARHAHAEAGRHDAADLLGRFVHLGELQLEGADDEAIARAARGLEPEPMVDLVRSASRLWAEWGWERRAAACAALAERYSGQYGLSWPRTVEEDAGADKAALRHRLQVLRWARAALAETGRRDGADVLESAIHVGELQLEGAPDQDVLEAFEKVDMGTVIELLQGAAGLYRQWGDLERARTCNHLAEQYARRERESANRGNDSAPPVAVDRALGQRAAKALRYAEGAFHEAGRPDVAERAGRGARTFEAQLAGNGADAGEMPRRETILELLAGASRLQREWGHDEVAAFTEDVIAELSRPPRLPPADEEAEATTRDLQVQRLMRRLEELQRELEEVARAVQGLRGGD